MEEKNIVPAEKKNALKELASRLQVSPEVLQQTLKATAFSECKTNEQFISAVIVANTYGLNPLLKEMYAFPSRGGAVISILSVDGWISLVNRSPKYNGVELLENKCEKSDRGLDPSGAGLESVTAKFYLKGVDHPVVVTEYMAECYNDSKEPWKKWPRRMLRHKAFIQGARVAFGFSGIYDEDEADRIKEAEYTVDSTKTMSASGIVGFKKTTEKTIVEPPKAKSAEPVEAQAEAEIVPDTPKDPAKEPKKAPSMDEIKRGTLLSAFKTAEEKLGNELYYKILGSEGYENAEQIMDLKVMERIHRALQMAFKDKKNG